MSQAGPQVNGPASPTGKYIDGIDPDDPEYIKNLQRPAEVKEDLQQMENRSRVSVILNSQAFKEELEQVVEEQLRSGPYPASLIALQQITDLLLPHSKGSLGSLARASSVIPINDLRGVDSSIFVKGEKQLRCKLAALYRLVDLCGWSHGIHNHISARVSPENEHFLLNPFGLTYSEITASSLVKVDVRGDIIEPGSTHLGVYKPGFAVHSAIHQARPDIKCIVHLHTPAAVAVSALKCGLLAMSQEALTCGNISYHDFQGVAVDTEERERLARNLGVHNKILILRNRGMLACGETVEEAFHFTFNVMAACEAQVKAMPIGLDNIVIPSAEVREQTHRAANQGGPALDSKGRKWKTGELEFEALMRTLDNSGFRTGYVFKMPVVKQEKKDRSNSEVEIPPASSSFTYVFDGDYEHSKYASPVKAAMERQKKAYKAGWLTTPNAYKKTELEEIGTTTPKKITKWVSDGDSPNRPGGTPIKIENPNQFAPQGENPKEYKEKQKSIKKDYYEERITAGPQSKILEGITWDEAQRATEGQLNVSGDQLIVVGAASKGIIQRDHQHNAIVYRQYYAANPFENMSEAEIEEYQKEVQRREMGESVTIEEQIPQPAVEVHKESPAPRQPPEPERPETEVRRTRPQRDSSGAPNTSRTQSSQGHHSVHEEGLLLAQLADKVVQTVMHDALSVACQGKGQQIPLGAEPQHKHHFLNNHSLGSQIISNHKDFIYIGPRSVTETFVRDAFKDDKCSDFHHHNSGRAHTDKFKKRTYGRSHEDAAGSATEESCQREAGASRAEGDYEAFHPKFNHLFHGMSKSGMNLSISTKSTVRGKVRAEFNRGDLNEELSTTASGPCLDHSEAYANEELFAVGSGASFECSEVDSSSSGHLEMFVERSFCKNHITARSERKMRPSTLTIKSLSSVQVLPANKSKIGTNKVADEGFSVSRHNNSFTPSQSNLKQGEADLKYQAVVINDSLARLTHLEKLFSKKPKFLTNGDTVGNILDERHLNEFEEVPYKNGLLGDGLMQTSLTKMSRVRLDENLIKSYFQELGKREETLLSISPFEDQKRQFAAISQELEDTNSLSQDTHHLNKMTMGQVELPLGVGTKSQGNLAEDFSESKSIRIFESAKFVLDDDDLIKHMGLIELSNVWNFFNPSVIVAYPVTRDTVSPMQGTADGRPRFERYSLTSQSSRTPVSRNGTSQGLADSEGSASKQKWVPKQKHERKGDVDQAPEQATGHGIDQDGKRRGDIRSGERSFGRQGLTQDVDPTESGRDTWRSEDALRKEREEKRIRRNEEARALRIEVYQREFISARQTGRRNESEDDRIHGHGEERRGRDGVTSRRDQEYTDKGDERGEDSRTNRYYKKSGRDRRDDREYSEREKRRNEDDILQEIYNRPDLKGNRIYAHESKYTQSGLNIETSSDDGSENRTFGRPRGDTSHSGDAYLSVGPDKTEDSDQFIKELKEKIEERKSRILETALDIDQQIVAEKVLHKLGKPAEKVSENLPAKDDLSTSLANSITAPVKVEKQANDNKVTVNTPLNNKHDTSLEHSSAEPGFEQRGYEFRDRTKQRDERDRTRKQDERDKRSNDQYRGKSQDRHRHRGRRDYEEDRMASDGERTRRKRNELADSVTSPVKVEKQYDDNEVIVNTQLDNKNDIILEDKSAESGFQKSGDGDRDKTRKRDDDRDKTRTLDDDERDRTRKWDDDDDRDKTRKRDNDRDKTRKRDDDRDKTRKRDDDRDKTRKRDGDRDRTRKRDGDRDRTRKRDGDRDRTRKRDGDRDRTRKRDGDRDRRSRGKSEDRHQHRGRRDYEEDKMASDDERRRRRRDERLDKSEDYHPNENIGSDNERKGKQNDRLTDRGDLKSDHNTDKGDLKSDHRTDKGDLKSDHHTDKGDIKIDHHTDNDDIKIGHHTEKGDLKIGHHTDKGDIIIDDHADKGDLKIDHHTDKGGLKIDHPRDKGELKIDHPRVKAEIKSDHPIDRGDVKKDQKVQALEKTYSRSDRSHRRKEQRNEQTEKISSRPSGRDDLSDSLARSYHTTPVSGGSVKATEEELDSSDKFLNRIHTDIDQEISSRLNLEHRETIAHSDDHDRWGKIGKVTEPTNKINVGQEGYLGDYDKRKKKEQHSPYDRAQIQEKEKTHKKNRSGDLTEPREVPVQKSKQSPAAIRSETTTLVESARSEVNSPGVKEKFLQDYHLPSQVYPVSESRPLDTHSLKKESADSQLLEDRDRCIMQQPHRNAPGNVDPMRDQAVNASISLTGKKDKKKDYDHISADINRVYKDDDAEKKKKDNPKTPDKNVEETEKYSATFKKAAEHLLGVDVQEKYGKDHFKELEKKQKKRELDLIEDKLVTTKHRDKEKEAQDISTKYKRTALEEQHRFLRMAKISGPAPRAVPEDDMISDDEDTVQKNMRGSNVHNDVIRSFARDKNLADVNKAQKKNRESEEDRVRSDVYKDDRAKSDGHKNDRSKSDILKDDRGKYDAHKEDTAKYDVHKEDRPKYDVHKEDRPKYDTHKEDTAKYDVHKEDIPKYDAHKEDIPKYDAHKEDIPKYDVHKEDIPKYDAHKEDIPKYDAHKEDIPKYDAHKEDIPKYDVHKEAISKPIARIEDRPKYDVHKEDIPKYAAHKEDRPKYDVHKEDIPKYDVHKEDRPKYAAHKEDRPKYDVHKEDRPKYAAHKEDRPKYDVHKEDRPKYDVHKEDIPKYDVHKEAISKPIARIEDRPKYDVHKEDRPKYDVHKEDRPKYDVHKEDRPKYDVHKEDIPKYAAHKEDRPKYDVHKEDIPKYDVHKEDIPKYDVHKEAISKPIARIEDRPKYDVHKEDRPKYDVHKEDRPKYDVHKEDRPKYDVHKEDRPKYDAHKEDKPKYAAHKEDKPKYDVHKEDISKPEHQEDNRTRSTRHIDIKGLGGSFKVKNREPEVYQKNGTRTTRETDMNVADEKFEEKTSVSYADELRNKFFTEKSGKEETPAIVLKTEINIPTGAVSSLQDANVPVQVLDENLYKRMKDISVQKEDKTGLSDEIKADTRNKISDTFSRDKIKVEETPKYRHFVKRTDKRVSADADLPKEDENDVKRRLAPYKYSGGKSPEVVPEIGVRVGKEAERRPPGQRSEGKVLVISGVDVFDEKEKSVVEKRKLNEDDRPSKVTPEADDKTKRESSRWYPEKGERRISDTDDSDNGKDVIENKRPNKDDRRNEKSVSGTYIRSNEDKKRQSTDDRFSKMVPEDAVLTRQEVRYPGMRNERSLSGTNAISDEDKKRQEKDIKNSSATRREAERLYLVQRNERTMSGSDARADDDKKRPIKVDTNRSSEMAPETAVPMTREAERLYPVRRNERIMSDIGVGAGGNKRRPVNDERARSSNMVSETAVHVTREAERLYPGRRNERTMSGSDAGADEDKRRPVKDERARSSKMVPEAPVKRTWRSVSEADAQKQDRRISGERMEKRFQEADFSSVKQSRSDDIHIPEDEEIPEAVVRAQEKQKYAGFVKRTGRGARKSHPMRGVSLDDGDEKLEEAKTESKNDNSNETANQNEAKSEVIIRDHFGSVVHENPIELTIDKSNEDNPSQLSPKKGIFSLFSCVGGKSADIATIMGKSKKKRPTAYYEEGEKRKIKKLSKEKDKEEKKLLYFEKPEETSESNHGADESFITSDEKFSDISDENPPELPDVDTPELQHVCKSDRYKKRPPPFHPPKPLSTFIDPAEALEALGDPSSEDDDDSAHKLSGVRKRSLDEESSVSSLSRRKGGQLTTFMSFGKSNIGSRIAKPSISTLGHTAGVDDSNKNIPDDVAELTERRQEQRFRETDKVHEVKPPQSSHEAEHEKASDKMEVQLRPKPSEDQENTAKTRTVRKDVTSQSRRSEGRLSDFIANIPPPNFGDTAGFEAELATTRDTPFPPPPDRFDSSYSSLL